MLSSFFSKIVQPQFQVFFLILGTAIGAGMITLPLLTQGLSLSMLTFSLLVSGLIMYESAVCWLDLMHYYPKESHLTTYVRSLAPFLEIPTHIAYLTFFWSLMAYYLSTMPSFIESYFAASAWNHPIVYAALLILFLEASPMIQGVLNQWLVMIMLGLLCAILGMTSAGILDFHWPTQAIEMPSLSLLCPLMMFFGYHLSIPSFQNYPLSLSSLKKVCLFAGATIGLLYWIWCVVFLSAINQQGIILDEVQFLTQLAAVTQSSAVLYPIAWFSLLAMGTSCLGMSLGTQHYLKDLFIRFRNLPFSLSLLNILPSVFLLLATQGAYRHLLNIASFLALYLLIALPSFLAILRKKQDKKSPAREVFLFLLALILMLAISI